MIKYVPAILFILVLVGIGGLSMMPSEDALRIIEEGGPIEGVTGIILFVGGFVCLSQALVQRRHAIFWLEFAILSIAMGIREMDPHRVLPHYNYLRSDFYFDPVVPLGIRLLFVVGLTGLVGVIAHFAWTNTRFALKALRTGESWAITGFFAVLAESLACVHHKVVKGILVSGFSLTDRKADFIVEALEEPLEMLAAVLLCMAAVQLICVKKSCEG